MGRLIVAILALVALLFVWWFVETSLARLLRAGVCESLILYVLGDLAIVAAWLHATVWEEE